MRNRVFATVCAILPLASPGKAQTPASAPQHSALTFEVASVKLDKSDGGEARP